MGSPIRNVLGIDIGTESVGSAWVDLEANDFEFAVSIFPRGVEEGSDRGRGAPKNQARRQARSQRRSVARRSARKRSLRRKLVDAGLYPPSNQPFDHDVRVQTPWELRRDGLRRALTPHEFGRVLVHLNQRRGALGIRADDKADGADQETKEDEKDEKAREEGKIKKAISRLEAEIGNRTFGQFMADKYDEQINIARGTRKESHYQSAIRNRRDALDRDDGYHATRNLIRSEFHTVWDAQKRMSSPTAALLTGQLKKQLEEPIEDEVWRERGIIFGQRKTYWDTGTLGRCDVEPSAHCCPHADMYVQEFRVLETVNNIRIKWADEEWRPLKEDERARVIKKLRAQRQASTRTIRSALGVKKDQELFFSLNLDNDPDREINTDWFYREIVLPVFGATVWGTMSNEERDSANRAILKFDPDTKQHAAKLARGASEWWNLPQENVSALIKAWKARPKLEKRAKLSRRAVQTLLPLMRQRDPTIGRWPSVTEARQRFAEDPASGATLEQRVRYAFNVTDTLRELLCRLAGAQGAKKLLRIRATNKRDRRYTKKHPEKILPPAPTLANPVVRKAIHEVRRHVIAWIRTFGRKPDQIVVELISEARQSAKVRSQILARNRFRNAERKKIKDQFKLRGLSPNQQEAAVDRVLLLRQQRGVCAYSGEESGACAYSGKAITEQQAVDGIDVEIDHIVPKSLSRDNGLNNKVLCYRNANRRKGRRTPKDGLTPEQYAGMLQRLGHLEKGKPEKGSYFSKKDNARKWKNLSSDTPDTSEHRASQYSDTAYAAKQVREWLTGALYGGERDADYRVVPSNGRVTSALRKDWQLQHAGAPKDRSDHRHHAMDALVIALSDLKLQDFLASLIAQEQSRETCGQWLPPEPVDPPWGTVKEFRAQVWKKRHELIVAHRPVKRRLVGKLHNATAYGKAHEYPGLYIFHIAGNELAPNKLRPPKKNLKKDGTIKYSIRGRGKTSVVRSPALRKAIRRCLRDNNVDPDHFTEQDIKRLTDPANYKLRFPKSGRPIYNIAMVRTLSSPIEIIGGDGVQRYYDGDNNHHIEVIEDARTGMWEFVPVNMYTAATRIKPPKKQKRQPMIQRNHGSDKRFVMSLSEGETVFMKSPAMKHTIAEEYDYFVVAKIGERNVHLVHHTDARPATPKKNPRTGLSEKPSERIPLSARQLQQLTLSSGQPPRKVRVKLPAYKNLPDSIQILKID